jgi:hypothetical protein
MLEKTTMSNKNNNIGGNSSATTRMAVSLPKDHELTEDHLAVYDHINSLIEKKMAYAFGSSLTTTSKISN